MRAGARAALCATTIAASTFVVTPTALAAASITVTGVQTAGYPYGELQVFGTATCATTTGTATIDVSAFQLVRHHANGWGSTTISCAAQPAHWSAQLDQPAIGTCSPPPPTMLGQRCFMAGSVATVTANVLVGGVSQASAFGPFPT